MGLLIDTSLLVALERGEGESLETRLPDEERGISVITVSELLHGAHRATGARRARRRAVVEHILSALEPVPIT